MRSRDLRQLRAVPRVFWLVLGVAVVLRVLTAIAIRPAVLTVADSEFYVDQAQDELFSDRSRPAGYAAVLRVLHGLSADIDLTLAVQHLAGLVTACLVYASARRLGARPWLASLAAVPVAWNLDFIFFEHALMSETLFTLALVGGAYAFVRALTGDEGRPAGAWLALGGALLGAALVTRSILIPLVPLVVIWALLAAPAAQRARWAAALAAGVAAIPLCYAGLNAAQTGRFSITATGSGLYSRVAQIADCSKFTPPPGTASLCEDTPPAQRRGPDFYAWDARSPAVRRFGRPPDNPRLREFAWEVIRNQPVDYARMALGDALRYYVRGSETRPGGGVDESLADLARRAPATERRVLSSINAYYSPERPALRDGATTLQDVQQLLRVTPLALLGLMLLTVATLAAGGPARRFAALALLLALGQTVVSAFTTIYSARYALPAVPLLAVAAAAGLPWLSRRVALRLELPRLAGHRADPAETAAER